MNPAWRKEALDRLRPTTDEHAEVERKTEALRVRVASLLDEQGWEGEPRIEGSVAKGTYLHGNADADVFIAFPESVEREELVRRVNVLVELLDDGLVAYAEHPYAQGTWQDLPAEIVPCYDIDDPANIRSAVDRTRFHTDLINARLDDHGRQEVRLLKAFLHHAGAYGAEESVRGFSGYLAELAILKFGDLLGVLDWATRGFLGPVRFDDPVTLVFDEPLVVLDPVDPTRNAAAAVSDGTLRRVREAAAAFKAAPSASFFQPAEPVSLSVDEATRVCGARGTAIVVIHVPIHEHRLEDPLHAQMRRATRLVAEALERDQVHAAATAVYLEPDPTTGHVVGVCGLVEADVGALDRPLVHLGPPAEQESHAARFRERWTDASDAAGPIQTVDGRLTVLRKRTRTRLAAIAGDALADANSGKAVDEALVQGTATIADGDAALATVPGSALGALLDRRRPWERGNDAPGT